MEKQTLLYEGKAKRVYATQDPELLIVSYKDDATAWKDRGFPLTLSGSWALGKRW